ncbi:hypothetical protein [Croceibacterium aestuarii]|uniref:hypothetical protein n=1 Tax=Croceibacterium aestuarii TaxID=3064139 RepID=UPI00272E0099|nr:hypothetical protein [Croceibacterium sp. D39]
MTNIPIEVGKEKLRRTSEARITLIEEHSAAFRWLMASFLAINGGGLLAISDLEMPTTMFRIAGGAFWLGIICALGLAWRSQVINRQAIQRLSYIELIWATAIAVRDIDPKVAEDAERDFATISPLSARAFSWASVACFSVGSWVTGFAVT